MLPQINPHAIQTLPCVDQGFLNHGDQLSLQHLRQSLAMTLCFGRLVPMPPRVMLLGSSVEATTSNMVARDGHIHEAISKSLLIDLGPYKG